MKKGRTEIICAIIVALGGVAVALVQCGNARESSIQELIGQLNVVIDRVQDGEDNLRERVAVLEALQGVKHLAELLSPMPFTKSGPQPVNSFVANPPAPASIPHLASINP